MVSCLLCLEINKDVFDCIKSGSTQWTELNITKIIEKHFWLLAGPWICLSCWQVVEDFHKFYLRIEEAHSHFGEIKVENETLSLKCKEETIAKGDSEDEKDKMEFCFLEPEVLIDQTLQPDLKELEIHLDHNTALDDKSVIKVSQSTDQLDDIPLMQAVKLLRMQKILENKDPLEKSKKTDKKRSKEKTSLSSNEVNKNSKNIDDKTSFDYSDKPEKNSVEAVNNKEARAKHRKSRKENDQFVAEHFKTISCDLCQVPLESFSAMQKHFADVHKQQGYIVCCKRKLYGRTRLVDHLLCHLNPDHFKCNECGKIMSDRSCFESHMVRMHRANVVVNQHSCDLCSKSFTKPCELRLHKLSHLSEDEKKFPCTECGKNYGSTFLLNQHIQLVHLRRFAKVCYICGKSINSTAEFKIHMNKHEGIPFASINCDVCGLRLTSERGLKRHKESQHPVGGKREHRCPICPKVSPTVKALKKHINTMHEKGYDYKCSICGKAFKRAEALREHMATHTGTTLYTCPWCPKTFNSNGNMHAHRKKVHPKEWEESKLQKYSSNILLGI